MNGSGHRDDDKDHRGGERNGNSDDDHDYLCDLRMRV